VYGRSVDVRKLLKTPKTRNIAEKCAAKNKENVRKGGEKNEKAGKWQPRKQMSFVLPSTNQLLSAQIAARHTTQFPQLPRTPAGRQQADPSSVPRSRKYSCARILQRGSPPAHLLA
jgi:hypothetical protein